jgi:hypothetical protein
MAPSSVRNVLSIMCQLRADYPSRTATRACTRPPGNDVPIGRWHQEVSKTLHL